MANAFAVKPILDDAALESPVVWVCPITGIEVPKDPVKNLEWRARMLALAESDGELRVDLYTAASQSVLFFVNAFCFTIRVFEPGTEGRVKQAQHTHIPFVTWPIQDTHLLRIENAIETGEELLTDKSRDMGATWDHIAVMAHQFLFRDDRSMLMISRKEDAVDNLDARPGGNYPFGSLSDPGTLFGKLDNILNRLPEWMLPKLARKKLHLINLSNRSRVDGESANATAGSSDRRTLIFLDEMAKMAEGEAIKRSTKDVTACRLVCSTPNGPGTAYSKWRLSGQIPVFILPWWEHPEKGKGRYVATDELGRFKIRSPWYDHETEVRSPKEVAIEIDMDHIGSGETFFEGVIIEEHKQLFARPAKRKLNVTFKKSVTDSAIPELLVKRDVAALEITPRGPWRVWCNLLHGRPDQTRTYTVACDISKGMGASNSTISVMCNETKEKVAEYADANTPPYEFAKLACAACLWVGGRTRPLLIWENNGDPGFDFGRQVVHTYRYPHVYFDRVEGTLAQKKGKRYGWRSNPEKKATALGLLRRAYAHGGFINHSEEALTEATTYVHYEGGGIGPAALVEESDSARKCHGDRVIADMLCLVGQIEAPRYRAIECPTPQRSFGYRLKQYQKRKKESQRSDRFDFSFVGA